MLGPVGLAYSATAASGASPLHTDCSNTICYTRRPNLLGLWQPRCRAAMKFDRRRGLKPERRQA
eukprot:761149-Alexandrium_andersonii.AAC.1